LESISGCFIAPLTVPRLLRSFRAKISYRLEQLWPVRHPVSLDCPRRNSRGKGGRGLSSSLAQRNPDPSNGAQTEHLYEIFGGSWDLTQMSRARARFFSPIRRAVDRSRARCRGCPNQAAKSRSLSREDRDPSG